MNKQEVFMDGVWNNNTIFVGLLGMCPLLGVTTTAINGLWMGIATLGVLLGSNVVISLVRKHIPQQVRIPAYIIIIAAFVTLVDLFMNAWAHDMHQLLGLFIPLIVVNCAIMGRAEAFASKNGVVDSIIDALGVGLGFCLALVLLGGVRELFGKGELFGMQVFGSDYPQMLMFILPPGAFIALALMLALFHKLQSNYQKNKNKNVANKIELETDTIMEHA
ncbi:MAG: electron transport complex subunit E [Mariprofundales bacterium]